MHYLQDFHNFQNFYFNTFMKYCFKWALTTDIYQPISDLLYVTVSNWGVLYARSANSYLLWVSICLLYICIVLDQAVGVVVCKASVLD